MNYTTQNKIHIEKDIGIFIGKFSDNVSHKHYALQISIALDDKFVIVDENKHINSFEVCLINSNVEHQFSSDQNCLIILINPLSELGHLLYTKYKNTPIVSLDQQLQQLVAAYRDYCKVDCDFQRLIHRINDYFLNFQCQCELENHLEDQRIYKAIGYLEQNTKRIVSLEEIANVCFVSPGRFLHLFKESTQLNFRRYQLWNRLIESLPYLKTNNITQTAHKFGFTDSSHYSKTFKQTFGLSPKFLLSVK